MQIIVVKREKWSPITDANGSCYSRYLMKSSLFPMTILRMASAHFISFIYNFESSLF